MAETKKTALNQSISTFKSRVISKAEFARPNLFEVTLDFPEKVKGASAFKKNRGGKYTTDTAKLGKYMVRAAQLPSSTIGVVEVPFRGRMLKIAGDRTFEPWTITVMNDADYKLRSAFEIWMGLIQENDKNSSEFTSSDLYKDMKVKQLSRGGGTTTDDLVKYTFKNAYPSAVSAIDLDWGSNDAIQEFTVEFQISHYEEDYSNLDPEEEETPEDAEKAAKNNNKDKNAENTPAT